MNYLQMSIYNFWVSIYNFFCVCRCAKMSIYKYVSTTIGSHLQQIRQGCRHAIERIHEFVSTILKCLSTICSMFVDESRCLSTNVCLQQFDVYLQQIDHVVDTQYCLSIVVLLQLRVSIYNFSNVCR